MRRVLVVAALLVVPVISMAQQPATPAAAQPKAVKMASDDVMALLEKGPKLNSLETAVAGLPVRQSYWNPRATR